MHRCSAVFLAIASALFAQAPAARIKIDIDRTIGEVDPHLFGNFAEHLGRMIYGGIYEEGSPLSDKDGYRTDVMEAVKKLGCVDPALPRRQLLLGLRLRDRTIMTDGEAAAAPSGAGC
jgi:hypothetical protein